MEKISTLIIGLLLSTILQAQNNQMNMQKNETKAFWVNNIPVDDLIKWRRHIHENPELSFGEEQTSKYVEGILRSFKNIEILKPGKTSVVGILKGSQPGKTVAFRADMDALPYPAIQNDPTLNALARSSAEAILGKEQVFDAPMMTASEDFAYYRKIAPVNFLTLGIGDGAANHNPKFTVDENALQNGVKAQVEIILDFLK